jgi:hypothetical protein
MKCTKLGITLGHDNQKGFSVGELFIVVIIICALSLGGAKVVNNIQEANQQKSGTSSEEKAPPASEVEWDFDQKTNVWVAKGGTPPACADPIIKQSPADLTKATAILYPGQYRTLYKPHGGIGFENSKTTDIAVYAPMDGKLISMTRYIEAGETQYVLTVINDCGIMYRLDHLATLTSKFQALAEQTPPATESTQSIFKFDPVPNIRAGEEIATEVGFRVINRTGFDFGVYDLRSQNEISKNLTWQKLHSTYASQEWYGVCWLDMLPEADKTLAWELPGGDFKSKNTSDYCKTSGGTTLDYNNGKPL